MTNDETREELMARHSLVAFVGALLLGQYWRPSGDTLKLPIINSTVPDYTDSVLFAFLLGLSAFLALAAVMPKLRSWTLCTGVPFSGILLLLTWVAFIIGFGSAVPELPNDRWWSQVILIGGIGMMLFIPLRPLARPLVGAFTHLYHRAISTIGK